MEIDIKHLHHAYFLLGEKEEAQKIIASLFQKLEIDEAGNPDIFIYESEFFGIDNARELKNRAARKAFGSKKIFVIFVNQITEEAQNALLKVLEEPTPDTHFFLVSDKRDLLPTLLSRMNEIQIGGARKVGQEVKNFLQNKISERFVWIRGNTEENFSLNEFLNQLIFELKEQKQDMKIIKQVFELSRFGSDRAANSRLILEHLALTIPESIK